jgi:hypothetical protein
MQPKRNQRRTITLDLPPEQIAWLDSQAGTLMSRSAFVRQLIASAILSSSPTSTSPARSVAAKIATASTIRTALAPGTAINAAARINPVVLAMAWSC